MRYQKLQTFALCALLSGLGTAAWAQGAMDPDTTPGTATTPADTTRDQTTTTESTTTTPGTTTDSTPATGTTTTDSTMRDRSMSDSSLPATATPLWLLGVLNGAGLMGLALGLRAIRRIRRA